MRGFLAFGVHHEFSVKLTAAAETFPAIAKLDLLFPADHHITIKFLCEFSSNEFFASLSELCALGAPPRNCLHAGQLALWPTVLALECHPSPGLLAWHSQVNALLEKKGFLKERHPGFRPHITLARKKPGRNQAAETHLKGLANRFAGDPIPLEAPALWLSQREETGRRYQPILSPVFDKRK